MTVLTYFRMGNRFNLKLAGNHTVTPGVADGGVVCHFDTSLVQLLQVCVPALAFRKSLNVIVVGLANAITINLVGLITPERGSDRCLSILN